jgi:hypothetical protein
MIGPKVEKMTLSFFCFLIFCVQYCSLSLLKMVRKIFLNSFPNPLSTGAKHMRYFNTTGPCNPGEHYMAAWDHKITKMMRSVERGEYFALDCPKQGGKTTLLALLEQKIKAQGHLLVKIDFGPVDTKILTNRQELLATVCQNFASSLEASYPAGAQLFSGLENGLDFGDQINRLCAEKSCVLIIDGIERRVNTQAFFGFLGILRSRYSMRYECPTIQSVITAGCGCWDYDESQIVSIAKYHPWNIAADIYADLSFSASEIAAMLQDYEADHHTGMDVPLLAEKLEHWTNGYPALISLLCNTIDRTLEKNWTEQGLQASIDLFLESNHPLLQNIFRALAEQGEKFMFERQSALLGLHVRRDWVCVKNRIFEKAILCGAE